MKRDKDIRLDDDRSLAREEQLRDERARTARSQVPVPGKQTLVEHGSPATADAVHPVSVFDPFHARGVDDVFQLVLDALTGRPIPAALAAQPTTMYRVAQRRGATLYRQAAANGDVDGRDPAIGEALARAGSGQPLPIEVKQQMERELGVSLDRVRIHTDALAADAAHAVAARAFTVGEDIFFASGAFAPDSHAGFELLAHELAHVMQGWQGRTANHGDLSHSHDPLEHEADAIAARVAKKRATPGDPDAPSSTPNQCATPRDQSSPNAGNAENNDAAVQNAGQAAPPPTPASPAPQETTPPAGPVAAPPTAVPTITHLTHAYALEADSARSTVGVGERVDFTSTVAGDWSATVARSDQRTTSRERSRRWSWYAPATAQSTTITFTGAAGTPAQTVSMTVVQPSGVDFMAPSNDTFPTGTMGAGFVATVRFRPYTVSFNQTSWLEEPSNATNKTGYFALPHIVVPDHDGAGGRGPNPSWLPVDSNNSPGSDRDTRALVDRSTSVPG